jgi:hypothetical protein
MALKAQTQNSMSKTEAEGIAKSLGIVAGAASRCDWASKGRVTTAIIRIHTLVSAVAFDDADANSAQEQFSAGFAAGQAAIGNGEADSKWVREAFDELEELLAA